MLYVASTLKLGCSVVQRDKNGQAHRHKETERQTEKERQGERRRGKKRMKNGAEGNEWLSV